MTSSRLENRAITVGRTVVVKDGHSSGVALEHPGNSVSIRMWQNTEDESKQESKSQVLQLTKLPARAGLANSSLAIGRGGTNSVNVVLNKTVRNWDDMTSAEHVQLPMIISRDLDSLSLGPAQSRLLDRMG